MVREEKEYLRGNFVSGRLRPTSMALRRVVLSAGFVSESAFGNGATGGGLRKGTKGSINLLTASGIVALSKSSDNGLLAHKTFQFCSMQPLLLTQRLTLCYSGVLQ